MLVFMLLASLFYISSSLSSLDILIPLVLIFSLPFVFNMRFKNATRVKEYNCGEKDDFEVSSYYFKLSQKQEKILMLIAMGFLIITVMGGF